MATGTSPATGIGRPSVRSGRHGSGAALKVASDRQPRCAWVRRIDAPAETEGPEQAHARTGSRPVLLSIVAIGLIAGAKVACGDGCVGHQGTS